MKAPLKVDNPITSKIDGFKIRGFFYKNNIGVENKDSRMYV